MRIFSHPIFPLGISSFSLGMVFSAFNHLKEYHFEEVRLGQDVIILGCLAALPWAIILGYNLRALGHYRG